MALRLEFSAQADRDFELIFDHLLESYINFGESIESGIEHAEARVLEIRTAADRIFGCAAEGNVTTIFCRDCGI